MSVWISTATRFARFRRAQLIVLMSALGLVGAAFYTVPSDVSISATATKGNNLRIIPSGKLNAAFRVAGLVPGDITSGSLTLQNAGMLKRDLALQVYGLDDRLGLGGGRLSDRLELVVGAYSKKTGRLVVYYRGPLSQFRARRIGKLGPSAKRRFQFWLTFPDGGEPRPTGGIIRAGQLFGDNVFMAARTTFFMRFGSLKKLGVAGSADSGSSCRSKRHFPAYIKAPNGFVVRSASATLHGKAIGASRIVVGKRSARVPVDLRGRPRGRARLRVVLTSVDGRRHVATRTYQTCGSRR